MGEEPDYCSSIMCRDYGCDYCMECSHASWIGEGKDINGKLWRWDFNPYFGPLFLRKDDKPLKYQPEGSKHPAWKPFETWLKKHLNEKEK